MVFFGSKFLKTIILFFTFIIFFWVFMNIPLEFLFISKNSSEYIENCFYIVKLVVACILSSLASYLLFEIAEKWRT